MADVPLFKGGTPDIKYHWTKNTPVVSGPPFGRPHWPYSPPFGAHYEAEMSGKASFAAGYPLVPSKLEWQRISFRAFKPAVGDVIQMITVPVNHYIQSLRLDVDMDDPAMVGATVSLAGQWVREDIGGDPTEFVLTDATEITAAAATQGVGNISLATPSSTVLWLTDVSSGYATPLYVEPLFDPASGTAGAVRYQGGGLYLGLKIETLPTSNVGFDAMTGAVYLTTRIDGYESPAFV